MTDFCTKCVKKRSEKANAQKKKYSNAKQLLKPCIFYIQIRIPIKKKGKNFKKENPKYANIPC